MPATDVYMKMTSMKHWVLLTMTVVVVTGWLIGCTKTSSSEPLIEYRRSGGFAGRDDHLIIEKNGETTLTRKAERYTFTLNSDLINHLQNLFVEANFFQLRKEYLPARQGSDLFTYEITYQGHTVQTMDGAIPPSLNLILEALNQIVENQ